MNRFTGSDNQIFCYDGTTKHLSIKACPGMVMSISGSSSPNQCNHGDSIVLSTTNGSTNQQWHFLWNGKSEYRSVLH